MRSLGAQSEPLALNGHRSVGNMALSDKVDATKYFKTLRARQRHLEGSFCPA